MGTRCSQSGVMAKSDDPIIKLEFAIGITR